MMSRTQFSAPLKLTLGGPANLNRECTLPAGFSVISSIFVSVCVYAYSLPFFKEETMTNIIIIVIFTIQFNLLVVSYCFAWQSVEK